jgi:hypothetical protein
MKSIRFLSLLLLLNLFAAGGYAADHPVKKEIAVSGFDTTSFSSCTGGEARTPDTWFWRPVLYQLSYSRVCGCKGNVNF